MNCQYCQKDCVNLNSHRNHERTCPNNLNRQYKNGMLGKRGSNQYLHGTICSDETKAKQSILSKGRTHTPEVKKLLSEHAKRRMLGGHTSKQKLYFQKRNGDIVYLQSSYEIRFAKLLEQCNFDWSRPAPLPWIDAAGVHHRYYPDFLIGSIYIDTKNDFLIIKDEVKIKAVRDQNNVDLRIVSNVNITLDYVKETLTYAGGPGPITE